MTGGPAARPESLRNETLKRGQKMKHRITYIALRLVQDWYSLYRLLDLFI